MINSWYNILLVDIMNRYINVFNSACDMFFLYGINCRLAVLVDESWSIGELESKVL